MKKDPITDSLTCLQNDVEQLEADSRRIGQSISETERELDDLYAMLGLTRETFQEPVSNDGQTKEWVPALKELNALLEETLHTVQTVQVDSSIIDVLVGSAAGIVAAVVDVLLVGTPEVVKLSGGGQRFDGSFFTGILRQAGNSDDLLSRVCHWCSETCKVPYDVSAKKGVVYPNNHRLRNPAHDPLFGLVFAVLDIKFGTATLIDNTGKICIVKNSKESDTIGAIEAVLYYLGHIVSDMCTARGIPIPGFFVTQFFTDGISDRSIARIAEEMYLDGYDSRHLVSMSVPVAVKNLIIQAYLKLTDTEEPSVISTITDRELTRIHKEGRGIRIMMISDAVACGGNVLKFFLPPTAGNMTALNLCKWISLLNSGVRMIQYETRDKTVELIVDNRKQINENWERLAETAEELHKSINADDIE